MGKARKRVIYNGTSTGEGDYNVRYDKSLYDFEYPDGTTKKLADNIIAEHMMSQVDYEGNNYQVLTEVTDHNNDDSSISKLDGFIKSINGNLHQKRTTHSCKLLLEQKDGSVDWVTLKYLKHSNPVYLAEYTMGNEISDEPDFNWWVKDNL